MQADVTPHRTRIPSEQAAPHVCLGARCARVAARADARHLRYRARGEHARVRGEHRDPADLDHEFAHRAQTLRRRRKLRNTNWGIAASREIQAGELVTVPIGHPLFQGTKARVLVKSGRPLVAAAHELLDWILRRMSMFEAWRDAEAQSSDDT
jgi:hypothetical protein